MEKSRVSLNQSNIRVLKSSHICLIVFVLVFCMRAPCLHSLAYILLLTGNLLGDLRYELICLFPFIFSFVSPLTRTNIFCDDLFVCYPFKKRGLAYQENKPNFYVGITKNSVDCLNAGNLF